MCRRTFVFLELAFCFLFGYFTQVVNARSVDGSEEKTALTLTLGSLTLTSKHLNLRYQLKNNSERDVWVCEDVMVNYESDFEVFLSDEDQALIIRRQLDVPTELLWSLPPVGRYIRLRSGEVRTESLTRSVPVHACHVFTGIRPGHPWAFAETLVLRIGYYTEDLLTMVRKILKETEKGGDTDSEGIVTFEQMGIELDIMTINLLKAHNKNLTDGSEQLIIPYSFQNLKGEKFSQITVQGLRVPFNELPPQQSREASKYVTKQTPLEILQDLFYEGEIGIEEYRGAEVILNCEDYLYNKTARRIADVYKRVAKGGHPPGELNRLLDKIANEQDRNSIFFELRKRKAEGALKKQTQILKLFQQAKKLDDENNSLKALTVLDELHQLAPLHEEAFDLKREISVRYLGQVKTNSVGMRLVWIPTGEFLMGTPWEKGGSANERPVHRVRISQGFWMGMYEVTQRQYKEVMGKNPSHFKGDDFPAEMVSWDDAIKFCRKLGQKEGKKYRLPTEAEWEYACRAGTTTLYSWGDTQHLGLCNAENSTVKVGSGNIYDRNVAVFKERGFPVDSTVPVGSFEANAFGLYDMHGNVREWCQDSFAFDFYENSPSFQLDPQGPDQNTTRVCRGGSWRWHLYSSRSAYRTFNKHSSKLDDQGFRVVLEGRIP